MTGAYEKAAPPGPLGEGAGTSGLAIFSWCLYDWANSAFSTVISTFVFAVYFTESVAASPTEGTEMLGTALSLSALAVALLGPVLGAIADESGRRKPWLLFFTVLCVAAISMLWFVRPRAGDVVPALILFSVATMAFEFAIVFYNAMLPRLVPQSRLGRVSGWGWGLGYGGGLLCLLIALIVFVQNGAAWMGLDSGAAEPVRATNLLVGLWFALFSVPVFLFTPEGSAPGEARRGAAAAVRGGMKLLASTLRDLFRFGQIARYLVARMIYTNGLLTLFAFGGIYAAGSFGMNVEEVIAFGIGLNLSAGVGAVVFAWVDDYVGAKPTILISLVSLILLGVVLVLTESRQVLWVVGLGLGVFVGPAQSASRSLMARLAPEGLENEMFGLYALSGKATAFLGPWVLGQVTGIFDSQRAGMATILAFFAVGLLLLLPVREPGK